MPDLVSIIMPVYNRGNLIKESINSVLSQEHENIELIIVDDGSTDDTEKIIKNYKKDEIIFLKNKHTGLPSVGRNFGLKKAKGKYIAFLDSDDIWEKNILKEELEIFKKFNEAALVCADAVYYDGRFDLTRMIKYKKSGFIKKKDIYEGNKILLNTALIKREVLEEIGSFNENVNLKAIEDYDLWVRLIKKYKIYYLNKVLAKYRVHPGNITGHVYKNIYREYYYLNNYMRNKYKIKNKYLRTRKINIMLDLCELYFLNNHKRWRRMAKIIFKNNKFRTRSLLFYFLSYFKDYLAKKLYKVFKNFKRFTLTYFYE